VVLSLRPNVNDRNPSVTQAIGDIATKEILILMII
jgi:hypothetical protein